LFGIREDLCPTGIKAAQQVGYFNILILRINNKTMNYQVQTTQNNNPIHCLINQNDFFNQHSIYNTVHKLAGREKFVQNVRETPILVMRDQYSTRLFSQIYNGFDRNYLILW